jgi:hypothetical protein
MNLEGLNDTALANEEIVSRQFKKLGYVSERLDRQKAIARPDLLIKNSAGLPQMLCEVKTVFSGGYLSDQDAHVSMREPKLWDSGIFKNEIDLSKIDECLGDAVRKRSAHVNDVPEHKDLPLLVAYFFDFYADFLPFYPRTMGENFRDVSGILTIERDIVRTRAFEKLDGEEQERRLLGGIQSGLPPNTNDFVLVRNKIAQRPVPRDFQLKCETEPYSASF